MKTFQKPIPILSLFAMLLLFVWACRKEKPEFDLSDKDPCSCASEVSAEFVIEEWAKNFGEPIWDETDTCNRVATMRFTAKEENATYKWYVGSEILSGRSVSRTFDEQWVGYTIPITLVVTKTPNNTCFPNDDGYDSITKSFYISEYPIYDYPNDEIYHPTEGAYRGIIEGMTDSIDITFNMRFFSQTQVRQVDVLNADGMGTDCSDPFMGGVRQIDHVSYRRLRFRGMHSIGPDFCTALNGTISRRSNNDVEIHFNTKIGAFNTVETNWSFRGRKIN
jgi:hypothetical protein